MPKVLREYDCQCGCGFRLQVQQEADGTYTLSVMEHPPRGEWGIGGLDWHDVRERLDEYDDYSGLYLAVSELAHAVILSRDDLDGLRILFSMGKRELPTAP